MLSYEVTKGSMRHYLTVLPAEIIVGSTAGSGHTDNAGTCTHAEFLSGRYNDDVERMFGTDVLKTVRAACVDATGDPYFGARDRVRELLEAWDSLERDPTLAALAEQPDEDGRDTGNAIAWDGLVYTTDRWHAQIADPSGARIASTEDLPERFGIGNSIRISWPVRRGNTVGFTFWTFGSASSPAQQSLGEVGVFVLGQNSEVVRWSPYSRTAATEHRRNTH